MRKKPVMLMILDGWGIGEDYPGNGIKLAKTPNFDRLMKNNPNTSLEASGEWVGLPKGQMGNSEVGHLNIGAGRVVYQELPRITKAIEDGDLFQKEELLAGIENAKINSSKVHLIGLVSDGGVHSHVNHLYGLLEMMKMNNIKDVYVHVILDGRDVLPRAGKAQVEELEKEMERIGVGKIATVSGRYYTMDRDKRWERTELAYDALVLGQGEKNISPVLAIEKSYSQEITDEFMLPTVILEDQMPLGTIENSDTVIFFNFRPDRARQITRAIVDNEFNGFERKKTASTFYITMTQYDTTMPNVNVVYRSETPINTLSQFISTKGLYQVKIAETEKYAHVTFFLNGGIEEPYMNEDRSLVPSSKVATYDMKPEMSAEEVKEEVINRLNMDKYDLIVVNFANPDMVGHTAIIPAVVKALETVDRCMGEVLDLLGKKQGIALITADHGNSEKLLDELGNPFTAHTSNKVPLILFGAGRGLKEGKLSDLAPTLLELMGLEKPKEMTGNSLLV